MIFIAFWPYPFYLMEWSPLHRLSTFRVSPEGILAALTFRPHHYGSWYRSSLYAHSISLPKARSSSPSVLNKIRAIIGLSTLTWTFLVDSYDTPVDFIILTSR